MTLQNVRIALLSISTLVMPAMLTAQVGGSPGQPGTGINSPGQGIGQGTADRSGALRDPSGAPVNGNGSPTDSLFLHKALEGGMTEIQLSQIALQKSSSDDVKQLAQKLIDDHTKLDADMMPFDAKYGVKQPKHLGKKEQQEADKLNGLSGDAFDQEYIAVIDKDHHKDVRDFKEEVSLAADPALKTTVQSALVVIEQHTQMADKLAAAHNVPVAK